MEGLSDAGRRVPIVVLENVVGALTSHGGRDFAGIVERIAESGYRVGALVMDASLWLPQSRPRLFIVAIDTAIEVPEDCVAMEPDPVWHTAAVRKAFEGISDVARDAWAWWSLPRSPARRRRLMDVIEDEPTSVEWHSKEQMLRPQ